MLFETFIQFGLQIHMLYFFWNDLSRADKFGVQIESILLSLILAVIHILMELFLLKMEAQASNMGFFEFSITSLNGCIGFVPLIDHAIELCR